MDGQLTLFKDSDADTSEGGIPHGRRTKKGTSDGEQDAGRVRPVFVEGDRIRSIREPEKTGTVIMVSLVTCLLRVIWDGEPAPDFIERDKAEHITEEEGK